MKKMNNKGWGFVPFLLLLLILISALFLTAFLVNDFEKRIASKKEENVSIKELEKYRNYENIIASEALKHYTDDEIVPLSLLPVSNAIKEECDGYAKKSGDGYKGYVSCGKYKTLGFADRYLNQEEKVNK